MNDPDHRFELLVSDVPAPLLVTAFRGREAMNETYRFDLDARVEGIESAALDAVLVELGSFGVSATFRVHDAMGTVRTVHGVISRARTHRAGRDATVQLRLVPRLALLEHTRRSRVFQRLTLRQIVEEVVRPLGIPSEWRLLHDPGPREYTVQYRETDLEFVARILADEGIAYAFEHRPEEDREILALVDDASLLQPIDGAPLLPVVSDSSLAPTRDALTTLDRAVRTRPRTVAGTQFDFLHPSHRVEQIAGAREAREARGELSTNRHPHGEIHEHDEGSATALEPNRAGVRIEQAQRGREDWRGTSRCDRLVPGRWFATDGAPVELVVTEVVHRGALPEYVERARASGAGRRGSAEAAGRDRGVPDVYSNALRAEPRSRLPRPEAPRRPVCQFVETATVVGPAGSEIHTDEHGRVRVQFHWDLDGQRDERSSCFVRCAQAWSGVAWGTQFIPRVGMEVVVTFVGGDPDRPLVLTTVPNVEHPLPFPLPHAKTKSGIRTNTSRGGGGYNELSFEDRSGFEMVHLRAERDLDVLVQRDASENVLGNATRVVTGLSTDVVQGTRVESTQGSQFVDVLGSQSVGVGGSVSRTTGEALVETVHRGASTFVSEGRTAVVGGTDATLVGVDRAQAVGRGALEAIQEDALTAVGGSATLIVGSDATADVGGALTLVVTGSTSILADGGLTIECGDSVIEVKKDKIRLASKKLELVATDEISLTCGGSTLALDGDVKLTGGEVSLTSAGASVVLDANLTAKAGGIAFNSGGGASSSSDSDPSRPPDTERKFHVSLFVGEDIDYRPEGAIVVRDASGAELRRISLDAASSNVGGHYLFELHPDDFPDPVTVTFEGPRGVRHLGGPYALGDVVRHLSRARHGVVEGLMARRGRLDPEGAARERPERGGVDLRQQPRRPERPAAHLTSEIMGEDE
ncbi:MAG: type VI secretion system tip protein TssI/VgrG [Polyangiaceae bacterium]